MIGTFLFVGGAAYLGAKTYEHFSPNKSISERLGDVWQAQEWLPQPSKPQIETVDQIVEKSPFEIKQQDRTLGVSTLSLGLSTAGLLSSATVGTLSIGALSIVPLLYSSRKIWDGAYRGLAEEHQINQPVLDASVLVVALLSGNFFMAALYNWLDCVQYQILYQTERNFLQWNHRTFIQSTRLSWIWKNDVEIETPTKKIKVGDVAIIEEGDLIPVDGRVVHGQGWVEQGQLTGDAQPVLCSLGDSVLANTTLLSGRLLVETQAVGDATGSAQINAVLEETPEFKAYLQDLGNKTNEQSSSIIFFLGLLSIPTLNINRALGIWSTSLGRHMNIMAPVTVMSYTNRSFKEGILIKDARVLEVLNRVNAVIFDEVCLPFDYESLSDHDSAQDTKTPFVSEQHKQALAEIVNYLNERDIKTYLISSSNHRALRAFALEIGMEECFAPVRRGQKSTKVKSLQDEGSRVCFVGDGMVDFPAMKQADVSIALGSPKQSISNTAQIILLDGTLSKFTQIFDVAAEFNAKMDNNLMLSIIPGFIGLAGTLLFNLHMIFAPVLSSTGTLIGVVSVLRPLLNQQHLFNMSDEAEETIHNRPLLPDFSRQ